MTNDVGCHDAADALTDRSVLCTGFDFLHRLDHARHVHAAVECLHTKIATSNLLDISPHPRLDCLSHLVSALPREDVGEDDLVQKRQERELLGRRAGEVQVLARRARIVPYSFHDPVKEADRSRYSWGVGASYSEDSDVEAPNKVRISCVVETV